MSSLTNASYKLQEMVLDRAIFALFETGALIFHQSLSMDFNGKKPVAEASQIYTTGKNRWCLGWVNTQTFLVFQSHLRLTIK